MISEDLQNQLLTGIQALTVANEDLKAAAEELARASHAYRLAQAKAFLAYVKDEDGKKRSDAYIGALVDQMCKGEMLACRLAEAFREAALERVRSLRTEISAMQSIAGAYREEAAAIRYGQSIG